MKKTVVSSLIDLKLEIKRKKIVAQQATRNQGMPDSF